MSLSPNRAITQGRTLLNCSQLQFEQFVDPARAVPRAGAIEEAAGILGYRVDSEGGLWYVYDGGGTALINAERSRRAALVAWWTGKGLSEVKARRERDREWEAMPKAGRPASPNPKRPERQRARSEARETSYARVARLWEEASAILVRHTAQADVWLNLAIQRDMPRLHMVGSVGTRRAIVGAVSHLYDVEGRAPLLRDLLNGGEATDEQIGDALLRDIPEVAARGEAAGVCARIALMLAVLNSPKPASEVFLDLHEAMLDIQIKNVDELKLLCSLAVG